LVRARLSGTLAKNEARMPMSFETEAEKKLIVALDFPYAEEAAAFWHRLALPHAVAKIGLELLMTADGVALVKRLAGAGASVFVDAKLYDIAATVERATARVAALGAAFLTVHAQDDATVAAAVRGAAGSPLKLLGISLLTNARPESLADQGITLSASDLVLTRAGFAAEAGFHGIVSSALEARALKDAFGSRLAVVTPGIRPASASVAGDDQARTATPAEAIAAGADYIVVGRPITRAADPNAAARTIVAEIAGAL
jgi:orotidine-5'-phosphate decarboxylase